MNKVTYSDNRRVKTTKGGAEFFAVTFQTTDEDQQDECYIHRYCLPGRISSYCFGYASGTCASYAPRLHYYSEGNDSLQKAMRDVQIDLDKPQVVEMLVQLCGQNAARSFCDNLIAIVAPKSRALRAMRKTIAKVKAFNRQAYKQRHGKDSC